MIYLSIYRAQNYVFNEIQGNYGGSQIKKLMINIFFFFILFLSGIINYLKISQIIQKNKDLLHSVQNLNRFNFSDKKFLIKFFLIFFIIQFQKNIQIKHINKQKIKLDSNKQIKKIVSKQIKKSFYIKFRSSIIQLKSQKEKKR
ncbi:transmembrane protein, putative (macronuclear) [Tetrahymena thermophila SB210]|uniref:Transmembrane protein, putative n=1 Tax=Tetrahymena thermophila (strain SB210) TaxID=312017 RepID=W7XAE7_TETTS|nr:transmembrane protein, putative [Tetrahymena thermophila SB210]EWS74302.1 transmembrane protein, putative [Tetrahymena thermophila SB210]|eukprot:XP_012653123.1 transmembrane protein, putative [Tetrahymena thermophila SB210]